VGYNKEKSERDPEKVRIPLARDEWDDILKAMKDVIEGTRSNSRRRRLEALVDIIEFNFSPEMERRREVNKAQRLEAAKVKREILSAAGYTPHKGGQKPEKDRGPWERMTFRSISKSSLLSNGDEATASTPS
jgi:hypothetical protein